MKTLKNLSPVAIAVIGSLVILIILLGIGASIAGSYVLMIHYVNALTAKQVASQAHNAIASCKALHGIDKAGSGIHFPAPGHAHPSELALSRLFSGIHNLYVHSGCPALLKGVIPT